jgi:hypothetical protein
MGVSVGTCVWVGRRVGAAVGMSVKAGVGAGVAGPQAVSSKRVIQIGRMSLRSMGI